MRHIKAIYLTLRVNMEDQKEQLGMRASPNEGAKFWLNVLTERKNRGVQDILFACVEGFTGFVEAIETGYPKRLRKGASIVHKTHKFFQSPCFCKKTLYFSVHAIASSNNSSTTHKLR